MTSRIAFTRAVLAFTLLALAGPSWSALVDDAPAVFGSLPRAPRSGERVMEPGRVGFAGLAWLSHVTGTGDAAVSVYRGQVREIGLDGFGWFPGRFGTRARFSYEVRADGSESVAITEASRWPPGGQVPPGGIGERELRQALLDKLDPADFSVRRLHAFLFVLPLGRGVNPSPPTPGVGVLLPAVAPVSPTAVPLPPAGGLLVAGLAALGVFGRRRPR